MLGQRRLFEVTKGGGEARNAGKRKLCLFEGWNKDREIERSSEEL